LRVKSFTLGQDIFKFRAFQRVSFQMDFATFKAEGIVLLPQFPGLGNNIEKANSFTTYVNVVAIGTAVGYRTANAAIRNGSRSWEPVLLDCSVKQEPTEATQKEFSWAP